MKSFDCQLVGLIWKQLSIDIQIFIPEIQLFRVNHLSPLMVLFKFILLSLYSSLYIYPPIKAPSKENSEAENQLLSKPPLSEGTERNTLKAISSLH